MRLHAAVLGSQRLRKLLVENGRTRAIKMAEHDQANEEVQSDGAQNKARADEGGTIGLLVAGGHRENEPDEDSKADEEEDDDPPS